MRHRDHYYQYKEKVLLLLLLLFEGQIIKPIEVLHMFLHSLVDKFINYVKVVGIYFLFFFIFCKIKNYLIDFKIYIPEVNFKI